MNVRLAGVTQRLSAAEINLLFFLVCAVGGYYLANIPTIDWESGQISGVIVIMLFFYIMLLASALMLLLQSIILFRRRQTLGKWVVKIQAVNRDTLQSLTFSRALARELSGLLLIVLSSGLSLWVDFIFIFRAKNQHRNLKDHLFGTIVIQST